MSPRTQAVLWTLLAAFINTTASTIAKYLGTSLDVYQAAFLKSFFGLVLLFPFMWRLPRAVWVTQQPMLQIFRAVTVTGVLVCSYIALVRIPLVEFQAIQFLKPLCVAVIGIFILRERPVGRRLILSFIGFLGVLIVLKPSGNISYGAFFAILAAILIAIGVVTVKFLKHTDRIETTILYSAIGTTIFLAVPGFIVWRTPSTESLLLSFILGALGLAQSFSLLRAYVSVDLSYVVPVDYSRVILASILGFYFFGEIPSIMTFLGALVIIMATFFGLRR